jgi:hypothetical protein
MYHLWEQLPDATDESIVGLASVPSPHAREHSRGAALCGHVEVGADVVVARDGVQHLVVEIL